MNNVFTEKLITFEITFADTGEVVLLDNLRITVALATGLGSFMGSMQATVQGLTLDTINRLTTVGFIQQDNRLNQILVRAGNKGEELSLIHAGTIDRAYIDAAYQPNPVFNIYSWSSLALALTAPDASSYQGSVDLQKVFKDLADSKGFAFKNIGVNRKIDSPYLIGSVLDKIKALARDYSISFSIDKNTLTIWDEKALGEIKPIEVSPGSSEHTQIGYPKYAGDMLELTTLFAPDYSYDKPILLDSQIKTYNRIWYCKSITHVLQSQTPNGQWFTILSCISG